jgi:hypothetical protein
MCKIERIQRKDTFTLRTMRRVLRYKGAIPLYVFSTDRGFKTGLTAVREQSGGIPLFKVP